MREITITISPTLSDISDPSRLADVLEDIEQLVEANLDLCVDRVAEKTLEFAKENASTGYSGIRYTGGRAITWPSRDPTTDLLYELSPYHESNLPGLDTGARKLITSLERGGDDNIFERGTLSVRIGTKFRYAHLLEKGGVRHLAPNIGFTNQGTPNRWLASAISAGLISPAEVRMIQEEFARPRVIEPRPFLLPAMWHMRDNEFHTQICAQMLIDELQESLRIDEIKGIRGDVTYVFE